MTVHSFHGDDISPAPAENALFHVIPVPLKKTVSFGEYTEKGPRAVPAASAHSKSSLMVIQYLLNWPLRSNTCTEHHTVAQFVCNITG